MKKRILSLLPLLLVVVACRHDGIPADVIDRETMVGFLADAYVVEGYYAMETQYRYDTVSANASRAYDSILDLHGLTREQVERSLDYYTAHLDAYKDIHDSVIVRLEGKQTVSLQ